MNELKLNFDDLMYLCSGVDDNNNPLSACTLSTIRQGADEEPDDEKEPEAQVYLKGAVNTIYYDAGCTVLQMDFPITSTYEFNAATDTLSDWYQQRAEGDADLHVSTVVVPMSLEGQLCFAYSDPVYFMAIPMEDRSRMILCFNTQSVEIYAPDDIDYESLVEDVNAELTQAEKTADREMNEAAAEYEAAKKAAADSNPYAQSLKDRTDAKVAENREEANRKETEPEDREDKRYKTESNSQPHYKTGDDGE